MNIDTKGPFEVSLNQKRLELVALSRQLREEHSQLRATYNVLLKESRELSEESQVLRTSGNSLKEVVDDYAAEFALPEGQA